MKVDTAVLELELVLPVLVPVLNALIMPQLLVLPVLPLIQSAETPALYAMNLVSLVLEDQLIA